VVDVLALAFDCHEIRTWIFESLEEALDDHGQSHIAADSDLFQGLTPFRYLFCEPIVKSLAAE
jgi:hypothetical protein